MSTFAEWKKSSKLFKNVYIRNSPDDIIEACQAAYKAGERQGRKEAELDAKQMKWIQDNICKEAGCRS